MRINIITRHAPANYGSILQAIATQKLIRDLGYDSEIVNYIPSFETTTRIAFTQLRSNDSWNGSPFKKLLYIMVNMPENWISFKKFASMRSKYLKQGVLCHSLDDLKQEYKNDTESIYLTGSDQVWGFISNGKYDPAYVLDFAPKDATKISFSSSFGKTEFSSRILKTYKAYLMKYSGISVREDSAVDLLHSMGLGAKQVLDPTLMLSSDEWKQYMKPIKTVKNMGKYILIYQIHNNPELDSYAKSFSQYTGLPLIRVSPLLHQIKRGGKFVYLPDISEFLSLINNTEYLITDSFHGTSFAINFNKSFIEVLPNNDSSTRNLSILRLLGLTDRILMDANDMSFANKAIDYDTINVLLGKARCEAKNTLKTLIDNVNI